MAIYILLGIMLLLILIGLTPISLLLTYNGEFAVRVRVLFLRFSILPGKPKKEKKVKTKKGEEAPSAEAKTKKKRTVSDIFKMISQGIDIFKLLLELLGRLAARMRVKEFDLSLKVGGENAADAGIRYGTFCAVLYPAYGLMLSKCKVSHKHSQLNISADFDNNDTEVNFRARVNLALFVVIWAALRAVCKYIAHIVRQNKQNSVKGNL